MSPPGRILIVDDTPAMRNLLRGQLQRAMPSAQIIVTESPEVALRLVEEGSVDAVVSDQHMPGGDGRALLARIAQIRPATIRVLFTAGADLEADGRDLASGIVHASFQKSSGAHDLVRTLAGLLEGARARPAVAPPATATPVGASETPIERPAERVRPATIKRMLVVDDVPQIAVLIESIAHRLLPPVEVVVETSSVAAAERIARETFDVILTDYRMPTFDGVELLTQARRAQPAARRILITGYNEIHETPASVAASAIDAYAHKPVATQDMLLLLRDALSDDPRAMDAHREQARIMEQEALRKAGGIELEDA